MAAYSGARKKIIFRLPVGVQIAVSRFIVFGIFFFRDCPDQPLYGLLFDAQLVRDLFMSHSPDSKTSKFGKQPGG